MEYAFMRTIPADSMAISDPAAIATRIFAAAREYETKTGLGW